MWRKIRLAFALLSRIPIRASGDLKGLPPNEAVPFFVLVGYAVGLTYWILLHLTRILHLFPPVAILLVMAVVYYLFDLFHFDGLLDTLDGFLCQKNREERLRIMKKGNVGPFGFFYGFIFLLAQFYLLSSLAVNPWLLFLTGPFSRWSLVLLLSFSRPAKEEGLAVICYPVLPRAFFWATVTLLPVIIFMPLLSAIALFSTIVITLLVRNASGRIIGGVTGDVLGALCLLSELAVLFGFSILINFKGLAF
ncbi:MAG: adenosylcobinamide-GDP ribazoletransferase [Candidatus Omnitrophota bacterium]